MPISGRKVDSRDNKVFESELDIFVKNVKNLETNFKNHVFKCILKALME